jgi:competence protein ComGF
MGVPDTSSHESMIIWILLGVIIVFFMVISFFLKKTYESNEEFKKEVMTFIMELRNEITKVSKDSAEKEHWLSERISVVETTQKDCKACP